MPGGMSQLCGRGLRGSLGSVNWELRIVIAVKGVPFGKRRVGLVCLARSLSPVICELGRVGVSGSHGVE